ncbi:MAG TPA: hypothetical protein VM142_03475 [Acidimicrobiales bacterium]|nr:hypothetical protein [Acidimicrobiales bacterium]
MSSTWSNLAPVIFSNPTRGTRSTSPKSITGKPEAPPLSRHCFAMAYPLVRPTRSNRHASSTVSSAGGLPM